ncbi:MAG: 3-hydroxyacyl-CoA dehydrogenase/enoyl-CoA hydratase family protein [Desulfobacteraceae bacterium]|nr:MAG: 3-hydroxyacyl-CoA dehydrogenase/enoyl-CoA hydratase family protein [Desulfobacteraceae bacterium]
MPQIGKVGVIGAGNMGSGIAQKFAQEGIPVVMVDTGEEFVRKGLDTIEKMLRQGVERKIFHPEQVEQIKSRIQGSTSLDAVADADLVIEAVFEDKEVKSSLFARLDSVCSDNTILATNTSSFYVREFANRTGRPDRFIGLHYFYHPAKNRLLEVIPHEQTSRETIDASLLAAKLHGKTAIVVKDAPGFAVNRFFVPFLNEAARMLEEDAANASTIEEAAKKAFRIGMGPFELMNVTGIPIAYHAATTLGRELGNFYAPANLLKQQLEKKQNWKLEGDIDPRKMDPVIDRFYGVTLGVAAALVDEGVASIEDTDRGAKIGLRWTFGPFEIMNRLGMEKAYDVISAVARRYTDFKMPDILTKQRALGRGFEFRYVDLETKNSVAYITVNRPEAMNALNEEVIAQLQDRFSEAEASPDVCAVVFQGAGKAFVAGADIRYFIRKIKSGRIEDIAAFTRKGHQLLLRIENSSKPTIALLDGLSLGGGSELALACQYVIATPSGSLAFPETGIGIYPGLGGMFRLAARIGKSLAKYHVMTGSSIRAEDAESLGIVTRLVPPASVAAAIAELLAGAEPDRHLRKPTPEKFKSIQKLFDGENARKLIDGEIPQCDDPEAAGRILKSLSYKAPLALKIANAIMDAQEGRPAQEAAELELERLEEIFSTEDALEGLSSLGRKRPEYKGR